MILIIILGFLIILYLLRISNNNDISRTNCKNEIDKANIENAEKVFTKSKFSQALLIISFLTLIFLLICNFTNIDTQILDYFSTQFIEESEDFNYYLYLIPAYIYVARLIIIEVNTGVFLVEYFKIEEPKLEENPLKSLLIKKPKSK